LKDPVKNIWVIQFGTISCVIVFPLTLIAGPIRGIPFYWQLIDCSFAVFGFLLLYLCYKDILNLEKVSGWETSAITYQWQAEIASFHIIEIFFFNLSF